MTFANFARRLTPALMLLALVACSQPQPQSTLTTLPYSDDFASPDSGWEKLKDLSADVTYENGGLRILVKQENLTQWSVAGKRFKDGEYSVDAKVLGGPTDNGYGVIFRVKDRKNFYHFEISTDGYWRAGIVQDGKWNNWDDWIQHPSIKTDGSANRITITMQGEKFTYAVNGQVVSTREDKTFPEGDIGVLALTVIDQQGTDVSFDNVAVTEVK